MNGSVVNAASNRDVAFQLGRRFAEEIAEHAHEVVPSERDLGLMSSSEFLDQNYNQEWLVENVLVKGQPAIVGGSKKVMKTSVMVDLAVSLATGTSFLGHRDFRVDKPQRVGLVSGESGGATLRETYLRVLATKGGYDPRTTGVYWSTFLPPMKSKTELAALGQMIRDRELSVIILDPLYLCLLAGRSDVSPASLFDIGPLLSDLARTCLDAGATPVLVHHSKKNGVHTGEVPELNDLAFAGFQEFARQWVLLSRREEYEPGTGQHRLWLNIGGSAGHSGCWALDIDEGRLARDFSGRTWQVEVRTAGEERQAVDAQKQSTRQLKEQFQREDDCTKIQDVLRNHPGGETKSALVEYAALPKARVAQAIEWLLEQREIEATMVEKPGGRAPRPYPGYRLVTQPGCRGTRHAEPAA